MQNQQQQPPSRPRWPQQRRHLGTRVPRIDGADKAIGRARYSFDINRPGMLHAMILRCPHAHAVVEGIDTSVAEKMPGVRAVHPLAQKGKECYFAGDEIIALAADTEEHAHDALRAIRVSYRVLDHIVTEDDAIKQPGKKTVGGPGNSNVGAPAEATRFEEDPKTKKPKYATIDDAFKTADVIHEGTYGMPTVCHQCLESHGLVAEWDRDGNLTVWASTQAVSGTAAALAKHFAIPPAKVRCITHHMGGGYGSKFGPDIQGIACAELARKASAPVKLMLDRADEITCGGNRPSASGKVRIGAKKDGTIVAYDVDCQGTPGHVGGATVNLGLLPYVYLDAIPNWRRKHVVIRINAGGARAMRAPGHPQNCVLTDCPIDDLAARLNMDPMQVRLRNLPPENETVGKQDVTAWLGLRNRLYRTEIQRAAELSEWARKWHPPGQGPTKGPWKHGIGMAVHTWGGAAQGQPNELLVTIARDGSVTVRSSTQDLGTAQRTVNAIVVAEVLGLNPTDITVQIGESQYGSSGGSGGSTTCPAQAPATLLAAHAARDDLFTKIAPKLNARKEDLDIVEAGRITDRASKKSFEWKQACAMLGMEEARGTGTWSLALAQMPQNRGLSSVQVGGVQTAEVWVDTETGIVRCTHMVAVQDCGLIVNRLGCESQVAGGVIMGVNYALFENRIMDRATGRQVNADMEFYKLGGIEDMPKITVHMHDMPERGVIGIGEPPTISTAAAIGNAVFNALGVRVPHAPYSPENVLAALAARRG